MISKKVLLIISSCDIFKASNIGYQLKQGTSAFAGIQIQSGTYTSIFDISGNEIARLMLAGNIFDIVAPLGNKYGLSIDKSSGNVTLVWNNLNKLSIQNSYCSILNDGTKGIVVRTGQTENNQPLVLANADYATETYMCNQQKNNSGGASTVGYRYKIVDNLGYAISVPGDNIGSGIYLCTESVANGSFGKLLNLNSCDGEIVKAYFSNATTAGHYAIIDGTNNGQFVDSVSDSAGKRIGIILDAGAAGLHFVLIQKG